MITPTDCARVIMPPLMKPTTSSVVTVDELSTPVMKAPVSAPLNRLVVSLDSTVFSVSPAALVMPSESNCRPPKNSATPPNRPRNN